MFDINILRSDPNQTRGIITTEGGNYSYCFTNDLNVCEVSSSHYALEGGFKFVTYSIQREKFNKAINYKSNDYGSY